MLLFFCCLATLFSNSFVSIAQQSSYTIKVSVKDLTKNKVFLTRLYKDSQEVIDSAKVGYGGQFTFHLTEQTPTGLFRIILGKTKSAQFYGKPPQTLDFIFNKQNVDLTSNFNYPVDSTFSVSVKDIENFYYYEYLHTKSDFDKKLGILNQTLLYYPNTDNFYNVLVKQFNSLQEKQIDYEQEIVKKYSSSYFTKLVKAQSFPKINPELSSKDQSQVIKNNYFKHEDFSDSLLMRSHVLSQKVLNFIQQYRNADLLPEEQEKEFIQAVDILIPIAEKGDPAVFQFVLDYIIHGFEKIKQENVLLHINEEYIEGSCENDLLTEELKGKLENLKKTAVGEPAMEIKMNDINGKTVSLNDVNAEYTLLIFWASWCGHCVKTLPQYDILKQDFNKKQPTDSSSQRLEIFAFSIDTDSALWKSYIKENNLENWIHCSELKGWDSKASRNYNIYATPTLFLLDRDKKIVAKDRGVKPFLEQRK